MSIGTHSRDREYANGAELQRLRSRLLDLTARNRLLSYRHPRGRSLRLIETDPAWLFDKLVNGDEVSLDHIPLPPRGQELEQEWPEWVREHGLDARPKATDWAKYKGYRTSYDLEELYGTEQGQGRGRRGSRALSLYYAEELERQLNRVAQLARTAIEDSGANILYLAFGFLSWRDQPHSDAHLAPLLLVPVSLASNEYDPHTRRKIYKICHSGEDVQTNLSLKHKLKRDFGLDLPDLDDDDEVRSYLRRCEALLKAQPVWQIHHYVTLGFFQFGKLLLYLDLDPDRWPDEHRLDEHPLVSMVLGGGNVESGTEYADLLSPDEIAPDAAEFRLVQSADSSQHSVVVDAARGRNLVVEGPPGTGKSQTITNIIGVALKNGQSVLFVSEKMAALEVVRSRLDQVGLGDFCLELHSHRTQRRRLLDDLDKRLKLELDSGGTAGLMAAVSHFEQLRDRLNEYARLINQDAPGFEFSVHDLLWTVSNLRSSGQADVSVAADAPDASGLTDERLYAALDRLSSILARRRLVEEEVPELSAHPLSGLLLTKQPVAGWPHCEEHLRTLLAHFESLNNVVSELATVTTLDVPANVEDLSYITPISRGLPVPEQIEEKINLTSIVDDAAVAERFMGYVRVEGHYRKARENAASVWHETALDDPSDLGGRVQTISALGVGLFPAAGISIAELRPLAESARGLATIFAAVADGLREIEALIDIDLPVGIDGLRAADGLFELMLSAPIDAFSLRSPPLETIRDTELLNHLADEQANLRKERAKAALRFDLERSRPSGSLEAATRILEGKSLLAGQFDADWRAANGLYKSLCLRSPLLRTARKRVEDLRQLTKLAEKLKSFESNPSYVGLLGQAFDGLDTPVEEYRSLVEWYGKVRFWAGRWFRHAPNVTQAVMQADSSTVERVRVLEGQGLRKSVKQAIWHLDQMKQAAAGLLPDGWFGPWATAADTAKRLSDNLDHSLPELQIALISEDILPDSAASRARAYLQIALNDYFIGNRRAFLRWEPAPSPLTNDDFKLLDEASGFACEFWKEAQPEIMRRLVQDRKDPDRLTPILQLLKHADARIEAYSKECAEPLAQLGLTAAFFGCAPAEAEFGAAIARLERALDAESLFPSWRDFVVYLHPDGESAIPWGSLAEKLMVGELDDDGAPATLKLGLLGQLADRLMQEHAALREFESLAHEELRSQLRQVDERLRELHRAEIAQAAAKRRPPGGNSTGRVKDYTEMALLRHEISKQRRHLPIRKLTHRAGESLKALKPCFMMGPLSVAQYLEPGRIIFDLLIMDEASQLKPEDALGAIARANQVIVVGDPKQLPPTSFFDRIENEESESEEDELIVEGKSSILELLMSSFGCVRQLNWHYRSQHESLIAFSNHSFYDDRLLIFPSPTRQAVNGALGITYNYVQGEYESQRNLPEAQEVLRGVLREIRQSRGKRTVGVVAINSQQAELLGDEWARLIREHPDLEHMTEQWAKDGEPFFIKNLENVQGDERDVIFISLTYGPDRNVRRVYQRFGPINQKDGWRRLNVLFTRAKQNMVVYSSMRSDDITPNEGNRGSVALRDFLQFCERDARLPERVTITNREPDSPFEWEVIGALTQHGYEAVPQVGVAGFYIDIGVRHPEFGEDFFLGVECDGRTYHSAKSARDRDHLRQEILEQLGWRIHRVWSADWYKRRDRELRRLLDAVSNAFQVRLRKKKAANEKYTVVECDRRGVQVYDDGQDSTVWQIEKTGSEVPRFESPSDESVELGDSLRRLRETISEEFPEVPADRNLLREDIIRLLVEHRPATREGFAATVPLELRQSIDREQAKKYLVIVLSLCEEYS